MHKMFFMSNLCRICISTEGKLHQLDSFDYDFIKYREKLEACTKMDLNVTAWSAFICDRCVSKLRISYEFNSMCQKSTTVLEGYLSKLSSFRKPSKIEFNNAELQIQVEKLPYVDVSIKQESDRGVSIKQESDCEYQTGSLRLMSSSSSSSSSSSPPPSLSLPSSSSPTHTHRKQRNYVSKYKRCSLLKDLLTKIEFDKQQQEMIKFEKIQQDQDRQQQLEFLKHTKNMRQQQKQSNKRGKHKKSHKRKKSLKALIKFTKTYDYGYQIDNNKIENTKFDSTPLEKLNDFVNNYFRINFSFFHDSISSALEETENWAEDDSDFEMMVNTPCDDGNYEEVIIEPDIIKREIYDEEYENYLNEETNFDVVDPSIEMYNHDSYKDFNSIGAQSRDYPILCQSLTAGQSSLNLLQEFAEMKFKKHKGFSPNNRRCRTRNVKYINPRLKEQFLHQDFTCDVCHRKFKSQGYLQAHCSKMLHNKIT